MAKQATKAAARATPLSEGRYALFETPAGGAMLVYRPDGTAADQQQPIPPPVWQLMRRAAAGEQISPAVVMKTLLRR